MEGLEVAVGASVVLDVLVESVWVLLIAKFDPLLGQSILLVGVGSCSLVLHLKRRL